MSTRAIGISIAFSLWISLASAAAARADLVRLLDGTLLAGRTSDNGNLTISIQTGDANGPRSLVLPRERVAAVLRAAEETTFIERLADGPALESLAAGYFHAEDKVMASACIDQLLAIDARRLDKPFTGGAPAFRDYVNRLVLDRRADAARPEDLLNLARWAREAELNLESARLLRRAWCHDRRSQEAVELARKWDVILDPWVQIDLTSALREALFTDTIADEANVVTAVKGKTFLTLPLWYETAVVPRRLDADMLGPSERRSFYGLRVLRDRPSARADLDEGAVYERLSLDAQPGGTVSLAARNTHEARRIENEKVVQPRRRGRPEQFSPSGWCAVIVELRTGANELTLHWEDGGHETIDLRLVRDAASAAEGRLSEQQSARALAALHSQSPATVELGIALLSRLRSQPAGEQGDAEPGSFDAAVLELVSRHESQIRLAAWNYIANHGISPRGAQFLRQADSEIAREWIQLARSQWAADRDANRRAVEDVTAILSTARHAQVCEAALSLLIDVNPARDWSFLANASVTARLAALASLDRVPADAASGIIRSIASNARLREIEPLLAATATYGLTVDHPRDPILQQFFTTRSAKKRAALLTLFRSLDLGPILYSEDLRTLLYSVQRRKSSQVLGDAADVLILDQCARMRRRDGNQPCFPVLVSLRADDFVLAALERLAARGGPHAGEARRELLLRGHAERVERALEAQCGDDASSFIAALDAIADDPVAAQCPAWFGLLGRLVRPERAGIADDVFTRLNASFAAIPTARQWSALAAVRSGAGIDELNALRAALEQPLSGKADRWINALAHLSRVDRKRLAAANTSEQRRDILASADLEMARSVGGRYGVIAVLEVCDSVICDIPGGAATTSFRWTAPRRLTLRPPPLVLEPGEGDTYRIVSGGAELGLGLRRTDLSRGSRIASHPDACVVRLTDPEPEWLSAAGWGWAGTVDADGAPTHARAAGPIVLPGNRKVLPEPRPGTMTLDVAKYLREFLSKPAGENANVDNINVAGMSPNAVPESLQITLRYAAYGSYYGVAVSRPPPPASAAGTPHLLNVKLILERLSEPRSQTSQPAESRP